MTELETVYTITDWYDGARGGVADCTGSPHYYENRWDENRNAWSEVYLLTPIDRETFSLAIEDWEIWKRWEAAFDVGGTPHETHPALPEDRPRHEELVVLSERLKIDLENCIRAKADFIYRENTKVRWTVIG